MTAYRPRLVFIGACLGMLLFGIVMTALGSVLPSVTERFALARTSAGSLFSLMSIGILLASVLFGPIVDRYGYRGMLALAVLLVLFGLEGIAFAPSPALLAGAVLLIGFGGGIINGGTNALVADISAGARSAGLSLLGVFFGIGAFGVPFVLGLLLDAAGYTAVLAALGVVPAIVLLYTLLVRFPAPKQPQGFPLKDAARLTRDPLLLLLGLILFFESGMEITMGGWTATYVNDVLALPAHRALYFLSLYWVGMAGARLLLGTVLAKLPPRRVLLPSLAIAFVGALLLIAGGSVLSAAAGVLLVGAGFAAVFPVVLGFVGDRYPQLSGTAFSLVLVMALTGGTLLPLATGVLGDRLGLRLSLLIVPAALVCAATVYLSVRSRLAAPLVAAAVDPNA
ncbi:MAG: MFS transporter [Gemmatimonadetes bacterium]|nr:MFS transporter [Gemmatimonadota bacterium]